MKTDQTGIFIGQWLKIARFFAVTPLLVALAISALATTGSQEAEALDSEEQTFLAIINDYRAQNGLGALSLDPQLNEVARWMANDLATNDYFSHTDSLGRDPFVRMDDIGYSYNTWRGENLVAGTEGAQRSFEMWTGSPGHNANMLGEHYTVIGIARAFDTNSTFGWYWATEFGGHTAQPATPPPAPAPAPPTPQPTTPPTPMPAPPTPQPVQTETPAPTVDQSPPPAPTSTPASRLRTVPAQEIETTWWRSLQTIGEKWQVGEEAGGTFVAAVRKAVGAFGDADAASSQ